MKKIKVFKDTHPFAKCRSVYIVLSEKFGDDDVLVFWNDGHIESICYKLIGNKDDTEL